MKSLSRLSLVLVLAAMLFGQDSRCPVCLKHAWESKTYQGVGSATAAYCQPWYDEKGVYHSHACNSSRSEWYCSRGHRWAVVSHGSPCPAGDFNPGTPTITITQDEPEKK